MGAVYRHKWEYRFAHGSASVRSPDLNKLGAEGWEIAAFIPLPQIVEDGDDTIIGHFLAKRPV